MAWCACAGAIKGEIREQGDKTALEMSAAVDAKISEVELYKAQHSR